MFQEKVKIYFLKNCPFCHRALDLIKQKFVNEIDIINVSNDLGLKEEIKEKTGQKTFPQIFINNKFIGGYTDLEKYVKKI